MIFIHFPFREGLFFLARGLNFEKSEKGYGKTVVRTLRADGRGMGGVRLLYFLQGILGVCLLALRLS